MNPILYTWQDVEACLQDDTYKSQWPPHWKAIEVYSTELVIYIEGTEPHPENTKAFFAKAFNSLYDKENNKIKLLHRDIDICYDTMDENQIALQSRQSPLPLFGKAEASFDGFHSLPDELPIPIIAFHSYKGGVGRTLSVIALARELSNDMNEPLKTLIIDADIEAPGLSWLAKEDPNGASPAISYIDILSILHDCPAEGRDAEQIYNKAVAGVADIISQSSMQVPADEITAEHYFVNAYREESQIAGHFPSPSDIVSMPNREFAITDFLSKIANKLNVNAVIVDLRAGFSELSAPFLFDPRVRRIFVSSTSYQSTRGTRLVLDKIIKSPFYPKQTEDYLSPTILLSMVPVTFKADQISDIKEYLLSVFPHPVEGDYADDKELSDIIGDKELSDIVIDAKFTEQLLHLEDIPQICRLIRGTDFQKSISMLRMRIFPQNSGKVKKEGTKGSAELDEVRDERIDRLNGIHEFARSATTAEGSASVQDMLLTTSLNNLITTFNKGLPRLVVFGPKGSGKTYLYMLLLNSRYLDTFSASVQGMEPQRNVIIAPLLATKNRSEFQTKLAESFDEISKNLGRQMTANVLVDAEEYIRQAKEITDNDWMKIAVKCYCSPENGSMEALNAELEKIGKKLVFIVDGVDDLFNDNIEAEKSKTAIRTLCQDFVNRIANYSNIGIIIFARNDMLQDSISTNYEQFRSQFERFELRWQHREALQLIVWVLSRTGFSEWGNIENKINKINYETAIELLQSFWGVKMGSYKSNEAHTARWVLAALSDFNGLLQARDIMRFLEYATETPNPNVAYDDGRYLMPQDIRNAINPCSKKKYEEVKTEMKRLSLALEALEKVNEDDKVLPLSTDRISTDDRKILANQGYLKEHQNAYYLPEIIRHALGYRYAKGGRAKVLSLLLKK